MDERLFSSFQRLSMRLPVGCDIPSATIRRLTPSIRVVCFSYEAFPSRRQPQSWLPDVDSAFFSSDFRELFPILSPALRRPAVWTAGG
jgi:hypothetical protein